MITIEEIYTYLKVKDELYYLCDKWAKNNLDDWEHYYGFKIDGDNIIIKYTYQNFLSNTEFSNTEYDNIKVPIKEIIQ